MKVIIAGSRTINSMAFVLAAIKESDFEITELVSGGAKGVDNLGEIWAVENKIRIKQFRAAWNIYGKSAGMLRNNEMAHYAEALIAIWDGKSKGTKHMIWIAKQKGMKVFVLNISDQARTPLLPAFTTGEADA